MRIKAKSVMMLSLAATMCGATALLLPKAQENKAVAAVPTGVFEIAEGAGVRYRAAEGKAEGLRFIVKMSPDVKDEIVNGTKEFGFIAHREDQFDGVTQYANMTSGLKSMPVEITADNVDELFYEGEEEYAGYWCANVVINMGDTDGKENFTERTYSAVAYYTDDASVADNGSNYVYTTNRQERSIQQVASKLYLSGDSDWAKVKEVYELLGTESTPLLIEQDGHNSYENLVAMVKAGTIDSSLKFELAENVVVEEKLPDDFTNLEVGSNNTFTAEDFYTVNHTVTQVYSTNKAIDLTDTVSAQFGEVAYTVKTLKGVEVPVENNAFTVTEAGVYTVTAAVEGYPETQFSVEIADNEYANGLILDGTNVEVLSTNITGKSPESVQMNVSFDENMKYDAASNGSYKVEYKMAEGVATSSEGALMRLAIKPAFSKAYYEGLKAAGYEKIAIRYYAEIEQSGNGSGMYYINTSQGDEAKTEMQIFADNVKTKQKDFTYILWNTDFTNATDKWAEMIFDIDKFIENHYSGAMELLIWQVAPNVAIDMTLYIDNIYAVQGAITDTLAAPTTTYSDKGATFDTNNIASNAEETITTAKLDGNTVSLTDGKLTLDSYGMYSFTKVARNCYGYVGQNVVTNGTVVSNIATNFGAKHIVNATGATTEYVGATTADGKIAVSSNGAGKVSGISVTTYAIQTCGEKAYYEALQAAGYGYITYEYTLSYTGTASGAIYRYAFVTADAAHSNNMGNISYAYKVLESGKAVDQIYDTSTKPSNTGFQSTWSPADWNGKTFIVSISIQDVINNYAPTMRILALFFNGAAATMDYSVTFGKIAATTNACVFD